MRTRMHGEGKSDREIAEFEGTFVHRANGGRFRSNDQVVCSRAPTNQGARLDLERRNPAVASLSLGRDQERAETRAELLGW